MVERGTYGDRLDGNGGVACGPWLESGELGRSTIPPWRQQRGVRRGGVATYQALRLFDTRGENNTACTVLSGSTVAFSRAQTDRTGPGQAFDRASIDVAETLRAGGCSITLRCTPTHRGAEGNEVADEYAKAATESEIGTLLAGGQPRPLDQKDNRGEDPAHKRLDHKPCQQQPAVPASKGRQHPPCPQKGAKGVSWKILPAPSGHAATGAYLADKAGKIQSSECWWCGSGERQTRRHLFVRCKTWLPRAERCGRVLGGHVGGSARGRPPSECSSRTEQPPWS